MAPPSSIIFGPCLGKERQAVQVRIGERGGREEEKDEEEQQEQEEALYLRLETRELCKLTRRSPNAVARRRLKPQIDGTTPRPQSLPMPAFPPSTAG